MDKGDLFPLVKEGLKLMKPKKLKALRRDYILREPVLNILKDYGPPRSYYAVHQLFKAAASSSANTDWTCSDGEAKHTLSTADRQTHIISHMSSQYSNLSNLDRLCLCYPCKRLFYSIATAIQH